MSADRENTGGKTGSQDEATGFLQKMTAALAILALVCGIVGYLQAEPGVSLVEAVYATATLYFINPVHDGNNAWIWVAKFSGLALASSAVLLVVLGAARWRVMAWIFSLYDDFTAVYTDNEWGRHVADTMKHAVAVTGESAGNIIRSGYSIILYSGDEQSLDFLARNWERFRTGKVYVGLRAVDIFLLKAPQREDGVDVYYFNVYDTMARHYWRDHHLYDRLAARGENGGGASQVLHIAFIGHGAAGRALFKCGYLNNLYSLTQEIHYHIWGCTPTEKSFLEHLDRCSEEIRGTQQARDYIHVHDGAWDAPHGGIESLERVDRIIVALHEPLDAIQRLLYINPPCEIHCCNSGSIVFENLFHSAGAGVAERIMTFGVDEALDGQAIKQERTFRAAKLIHYGYCRRQSGKEGGALTAQEDAEVERCWKELNGFLRGSNIAAADHYWIKMRLAKGANIMESEEIRRLEHVRWCRYHFYNRWRHAAERDNARRCHPDLIPYDELTPEAQQKDEISTEIRKALDSLFEA